MHKDKNHGAAEMTEAERAGVSDRTQPIANRKLLDDAQHSTDSATTLQERYASNQVLDSDELMWLRAFAATGNKRQALTIAFGYDTTDKEEWPNWKIYNRTQSILQRAGKQQEWSDILAQHELSLPELAAHLKRLIHCGNPKVEVNALKLTLETSQLMNLPTGNEGPRAELHFHLGTAPALPPANADAIDVTPGAPPPQMAPDSPREPFTIAPSALHRNKPQSRAKKPMKVHNSEMPNS